MKQIPQNIEMQEWLLFLATAIVMKCMMYIRVVRDALGACGASKMLMRGREIIENRDEKVMR